MSNSLCKSSVTYQDVIVDVIQNVRDNCLEDGLDEAVLQELKSLWETKLAASKAVEEVREVDKLIVHNKAQKLQQQQQNYLNQIVQQQNQAKQLVGQVPPNNHIPQGIAFPEWRRVPVQLTIPSSPGCATGEQRVLGIEVPEVFLQGHHLKSILTGPIISATLNLPLEAATTFLQDQVNNAFLKHQQSTNFVNINMNVTPSIVQTDGCTEEPIINYIDKEQIGGYKRRTNELFRSKKHRWNCRIFGQLPLIAELVPKPEIEISPNIGRHKTCNKTTPTTFLYKSNISTNMLHKIYQGDGMHSSSDDDDLDDEDDEINHEDDDDLHEDIEEETQEVAEDEPLNSEDDVSDADGTEESFETDNVIVCQFDKITRARNRWKFHLKDGIMNLNGEDYVFQKANGDAEW
ncbi:transcription initiation factor IIA subunit 1 isoform X2 [Dendroctonus ponderosae]|uniref:transcription initiation factor IIA subunit 1 isoform X2 n=1 Tax=Dendroctonus ponderosae TaxID=77166 RepID=UPI002035F4EE|nr:transcription initiation factor IIA subunit 1 isoform X2 [Dendroctonus ponderosae]KAH1023654.1 hypothetical protein HUJ04_012818 [Dendroctonus ponderosae]KAH1030099.1 hypothetical protein HUJ05_003224 [Dendroctonus ponderosae]